jgi:hypothetical protein
MLICDHLDDFKIGEIRMENCEVNNGLLNFRSRFAWCAEPVNANAHQLGDLLDRVI